MMIYIFLFDMYFMIYRISRTYYMCFVLVLLLVNIMVTVCYSIITIMYVREFVIFQKEEEEIVGRCVYSLQLMNGTYFYCGKINKIK